MQDYLTLALELRRRVKEQLKRMGGIEYSKVNFSYLDKKTGQETFITCKELGSIQIIPDKPLEPGDVFTVGYDDSEGRYSLFRIQIQTNFGGHRFNVIGTYGVLSPVEGLGDKLRIAMDSGARRVILPSENKRDFADLPAKSDGYKIGARISASLLHDDQVRSRAPAVNRLSGGTSSVIQRFPPIMDPLPITTRPRTVVPE